MKHITYELIQYLTYKQKTDMFPVDNDTISIKAILVNMEHLFFNYVYVLKFAHYKESRLETAENTLQL